MAVLRKQTGMVLIWQGAKLFLPLFAIGPMCKVRYGRI